MAHFLFQEDNAYMDSVLATIREVIAARNQWGIDSHDFVGSCSIKALDKTLIEGRIPVGSVEFIEKALSCVAQEQVYMKPINVPSELQTMYFLGRTVLDDVAKEDIDKAFKELGVSILFIKSATRLKTPETDLYMAHDSLHPLTSERFFISTIVPDIVSEWRCFVWDGMIQDVRRYMGDPWSPMPDKGWVKETVQQFKSAPRAYTLDIGMTSTQKPIVIEAHNFVSCGLYGFESPIITSMLAAGWKHELNKLKK